MVGEYFVESLTTFLAHTLTSDGDDLFVIVKVIRRAINNVRCVKVNYRLGHSAEQGQVHVVVPDGVPQSSATIASSVLVFHSFNSIENLEDLSLEVELASDARVLCLSSRFHKLKHTNQGFSGVSVQQVPVDSLVEDLDHSDGEVLSNLLKASLGLEAHNFLGDAEVELEVVPVLNSAFLLPVSVHVFNGSQEFNGDGVLVGVLHAEAVLFERYDLVSTHLEQVGDQVVVHHLTQILL